MPITPVSGAKPASPARIRYNARRRQRRLDDPAWRAATNARHNTARRRKYATDPEYAEARRVESREYHKLPESHERTRELWAEHYQDAAFRARHQRSSRESMRRLRKRRKEER